MDLFQQEMMKLRFCDATGTLDSQVIERGWSNKAPFSQMRLPLSLRCAKHPSTRTHLDVDAFMASENPSLWPARYFGIGEIDS